MLGALYLVCYGFGFYYGAIFWIIPSGWFLLTVTWGISIPGIVAGIGFLARKWWARPVAAVVSLPVLLFIPLGTALSIYTYCIISKPEVASYLGVEIESQAQ